jgi:hypothetical protein
LAATYPTRDSLSGVLPQCRVAHVVDKKLRCTAVSVKPRLGRPAFCWQRAGRKQTIQMMMNILFPNYFDLLSVCILYFLRFIGYQKGVMSTPDKRIAQSIGARLRNLLKLPKAHVWVCYEWFYSNIDRLVYRVFFTTLY